MTVSDLGWVISHDAGKRAARVGPHAASYDNPREIWFRDSDVADLLAGAMWLVHTGNGGTNRDDPVALWHGLRPSGAAFGSPNSDHKAGVAMDLNWPDHPWEIAVGVAAYDRHMQDARHKATHATYSAVEARMTVPGDRPVVRWCGRSWAADAGWSAYARGRRDCMHWTIGTTNRARIKAAVNHLHRFFVPPKTAADVIALQKRLGITTDGVWGAGSVAAMRAEQRRLKVPATGLPGDVATRAAWAKSYSSTPPPRKPEPAPAAPKPDPNKGFPGEHLERVESQLDALGYEAADVWARVRAYQEDHGLTTDGLPGPITAKSIGETMTTLKDVASDVTSIKNALTGTGVRDPFNDKGARVPLANLIWANGHRGSETNARLRRLEATTEGYRVALEALASREGTDPAAIQAAVEAGVSAALGKVEADVRLVIETGGE